MVNKQKDIEYINLKCDNCGTNNYIALYVLPVDDMTDESKKQAVEVSLSQNFRVANRLNIQGDSMVEELRQIALLRSNFVLKSKAIMIAKDITSIDYLSTPMF